MASQKIEAVKAAVQDLVEKTDPKVAAAAGAAVAVGAGALLYRRYKRNAPAKAGPLTPDTLPAGAYDAVIVGAGPSGSVMANFAARGGAKVALLDKATFPRGALLACLCWAVVACGAMQTGNAIAQCSSVCAAVRCSAAAAADCAQPLVACVRTQTNNNTPPHQNNNTNNTITPQTSTAATPSARPRSASSRSSAS